jgi:outer membrane phospholipase A
MQVFCLFVAVWTFFAGIVYADESVSDADQSFLSSNPSFEQFFESYQPYLKKIRPYEPIYFLIGTNPEKSKFQFSFRYQLFNPEAPALDNAEWLEGLNFGFTQTSYWDLKSASKPFEDSSYKPEIFLLSTNLSQDDGYFKGLFWQAGIQHESNGQGGDASRSTNNIYYKQMFIFYDKDRSMVVQFTPKILTYIANDNDTNPGLEEYRGFFGLEIKLGKENGMVLQADFRPAKQGNSLYVDLTYPIHKYFSNNLGAYLHLQYVNSLAENLKNYQDRTDAFRIGISFIR